VLRLLDVALAALGLVLGLPLLLLVLLLGLFDTGSPIFRQVRVGRQQQPFMIWKFRTMRPNTASVATHLADASAITPFGRFLRRTKLDELPQLWNVLKGEMSLVGPRPLLMEYLPLYTPEQARRHEVRPGITGWAQVNGRNAISWADKFALDVWYVDHRSLWLDVRILWRTVRKVMVRDGISAAGEATMSKFTGSKS
jgi:lipopolysaccharide/colanic/teichoic acid biosynthesis glycosyltransferase